MKIISHIITSSSPSTTTTNKKNVASTGDFMSKYMCLGPKMHSQAYKLQVSLKAGWLSNARQSSCPHGGANAFQLDWWSFLCEVKGSPATRQDDNIETVYMWWFI